MKTKIVFVLLALSMCPYLAHAQQKKPGDIAPAEKLAEGWDEIDQRLIFLMVRLANVETSLDAVEKAIGSGTRKKSVKAGDAKRADRQNEEMDRKGGGPMRWFDFYGTTAEKFFYHPTDQNTTYHTNTVLSQQGPRADNKVGGGVPAGQGLPVHQRPPQFDYIYRSNEKAKERAEADAAELKGKIEALIERRQRLEAEQAGLWCEIAFRAVSHYDLDKKPLYRFEPVFGVDTASRENAESMKAAASFMALALSIMAEAEKDQAATFSKIKPAVAQSRQNLNDTWLRLAVDVTDRKSNEGRFAALAKRLDDVASNLSDSYVVAIEGDQAKDQQRKETFRALLQESLVNYAQIILALDEMSGLMKSEWKIKPNVDKPIQFVSLANVRPILLAPSSAAAAPLPNATPLVKQQGTTVDLLKLVKVDEDTVAGAWRLSGGALVTDDDRTCNLRLPLPENEAYRLEIDVRRTRGHNGFFVNIPSFGFYSAIELDGGPPDSRYSGLAKIDGRQVRDNETKKPGTLFTTGVVSHIVVEVKQNHITATVDGRSAVDWRGDLSLLSTPSRDPRASGLGSWSSEGRTYVVSKILLTSQ